MLAERRRAGLAARKVNRLRECHGARRARNALVHNAVVGGKNEKMLFFDLVMHAPGDPRELHGEVFEPPETAGGLGKLRLTAARLFHGRSVRRRDLCCPFSECHAFVSLVINPLSKSQRAPRAVSSCSSSVKVAAGQSASALCKKSFIGILPSLSGAWASNEPSLLCR